MIKASRIDLILTLMGLDVENITFTSAFYTDHRATIINFGGSK